MPLVPLLEQPTDCLGDSPPGQSIGYKFYVGVEFYLCVTAVYMGILHLGRRHRKLANAFDILSAVYLLWATYTRQFYLHNTQVSQFAYDVCAAFTGDTTLLYKYLVVTIASWIASTFLEYKGIVFLKRLYTTKLRRLARSWPCLSHGRMVVLVTATFCTINSMFLTLLFWGGVQKSLENVTLGTSVWAFLTFAAFMKLSHQGMEGFTFITGIAVKDFKWRNSNSDKLFGQIAFSSLILLVYSSVLTHSFTNQEAKVWSAERCVIFVAICTDVVFHLVVFAWASYNSCCFATVTKFVRESHAVVTDPSSFLSYIAASMNPTTFRNTCVAYIHQWLGRQQQNSEPLQVQLNDIDYAMDEMVFPSIDIRHLTQHMTNSHTFTQDSCKTHVYFMIPPLTQSPDLFPLPLSRAHAIDHTDDVGIPYALCKWENFPRYESIFPEYYALQSQKAALIVPSITVPPLQHSPMCPHDGVQPGCVQEQMPVTDEPSLSASDPEAWAQSAIEQAVQLDKTATTPSSHSNFVFITKNIAISSEIQQILSPYEALLCGDLSSQADELTAEGDNLPVVADLIPPCALCNKEVHPQEAAAATARGKLGA